MKDVLRGVIVIAVKINLPLPGETEPDELNPSTCRVVHLTQDVRLIHRKRDYSIHSTILNW